MYEGDKSLLTSTKRNGLCDDGSEAETDDLSGVSGVAAITNGRVEFVSSKFTSGPKNGFKKTVK